MLRIVGSMGCTVILKSVSIVILRTAREYRELHGEVILRTIKVD